MFETIGKTANETNYTEIMKQDFPHDFAEDDEFISALLNLCENAKEKNE